MKESCCHVCGCACSLRDNIGRIDRYLIFIPNAKVNFDPSYAKRFLPSAKTNNHYVLLCVLSVSRTYSVFPSAPLSSASGQYTWFWGWEGRFQTGLRPVNVFAGRVCAAAVTSAMPLSPSCSSESAGCLPPNISSQPPFIIVCTNK